MSAVAGVNVAMLPEEQPEFWSYLETTGDIWACALGDNPRDFKYPPLPVAKFLKRYAKRLRKYGEVDVLIGHRDAVLKPRVETVTELVGYRVVPVIQIHNGQVVPGVTQMVGGKKVKRPTIRLEASQLMRYDYGVPDETRILNRTSVSYYWGHYQGTRWVKQPDEFSKWAKKVLAWLRRRITDQVPVHRGHYEISATALTAKAVRKGLKVV